MGKRLAESQLTKEALEENSDSENKQNANEDNDIQTPD